MLDRVTVRSFRRALNMKDATLDRDVVWETASGKCVQVQSRRLVSFVHRHLAAIEYRVTLLDRPASLIVSSEMFTELGGVAGEASEESDPCKSKKFQSQVFDPISHQARDRRISLAYRTRNRKPAFACGIDHVVTPDGIPRQSVEVTETTGRFAFRVEAQAGQTIRLVKFLTYHTSPEHDGGEIDLQVRWSLDRAVEEGFDTLLESQIAYMDDFWRRSDLRVEGGIRGFSSACVSTSSTCCRRPAGDDDRGIPAKGLTGQAYDGLTSGTARSMSCRFSTLHRRETGQA